MPKKKKPFMICSIVVISMACAVLFIEAFTTFIDTFTPTMRLSLAQYQNGHFVQSGDVFIRFTTPTNIGGEIANYYIETSDGRHFFLPDLSEEEAIEMMKSNTNAPFEYLVRDRGEGNMTYSNGQESFDFRNGKLSWASFKRSPIAISPNKEGPYLGLPIRKESLIRVFGKPKWKTTTTSTGA